MKTEAPVLKGTILKASEIGGRLFRNNRGFFYTLDGRKTRAGLEAEGASDLIGGFPVVVTPDMVGKTVCVLGVIETKKPDWTKPTDKRERDQENFINFFKGMGAIAAFINNPENLKKVVDDYKSGL